MAYGLDMSAIRIGLATAAILVTISYALGSGYWVSSDAGWYRSLVQPAWQPPDWVFGVIWPYNFIVLGFTGFIVAKQATLIQAWFWLGFYVLSVGFALAWSYLFYVPHNIGASAIALALAALLTLPVVIITFQIDLKYALLLLPYQIWIIVATFLAFSYAARN
jgi:tryptophan-rich sensory protein